ncbi:hypothetical protein JX265_005885 [Neoarthrinium moseri]|uniref:FAD-binding PCMH-type domain-containing protein n=1 Tax=Neoarthrinium moseri TaxID=1658444 RepID=A0A9P9WNJ3_9PEZI|nr:hypothetical protein JX265_005885 [Neoarthrinium moseri]
MLARYCLFLVALGYGGAAQSFEPEHFSVIDALFAHGVNISEVPGLANLYKRGSTTGCIDACNAFVAIYGSDTVYNRDEPLYENFTSSYWSAFQADVKPGCVFSPTDAAAVSVAVLISRFSQCPFAVKSGGHAAFAGASSIDGGITISLKDLNTIELSEDKVTASIGPGNTWGKIYSTLEQENLSVIGGRVADIGIGGLTTGGGISFFSNIYGWACDNVASYDVVTACGNIVHASPTEHPDLYWALRGGGNNFGIVVNFNLETLPLPGGEIWGGSRVYLEDSFPALVDAFADYAIRSPEDPYAGAWLAMGVSNGTKLASAELWYAAPNAQNASIFNKWNNIASIQDAVQNRILSELTNEIASSNPYGLRELYYTITVKASSDILPVVMKIYFEELSALLKIDGAAPYMIWQAITHGVLGAMAKNGGNPLGLNSHDGPFYLIHISSWWNQEKDDAAMYQGISTIMSRINSEAVNRGLETDYVYMNYASRFQDVIASYSSENKEKLQSIARKYDPEQVFQVLQPGYFKLDRAPSPDLGYFSF